jgi:Large polyvalent protein associated domain 39
MPFDIAGAKKAGYTDEEILNYLAPQAKFDVAGAKQAGYSDTEILGYLGQKAGAPASKERTWGEALVTDPFASLVSGGAQVLQLPGQLQRLVTGTGRPEEGLEGLGARAQDIARQMQSEGLKAREEARSKEVAEAAKEGGASGILKAAGVAAWQTIKDPALLSTLLTEQIPQLAISSGVGAAAKGVTAARMAAAGAAKDAIVSTSLKVGVSANVATGALLQGADVGSDAYKETYDYLTKNGTSPEKAHTIAVNKARQAAAAAAAISVATQNIPGANRAEKALLGEKAGEGLIKGAIKTGAGEAFTEGLEEGGGQVAKNIAVGQVDPTRQLSQGVGEAIGLGAVGGLGLGAPIGALQGRAEAAKSQLVKDTEALVGTSPVPDNRDTLVKNYQRILSIPREEAELLADQAIKEKAAAKAAPTPTETTAAAPTETTAITAPTETPVPTAPIETTTTAAPTETTAITAPTETPVPTGIDPQRLKEVEVEYINAGYSVKEAKQKAIEQVAQEVKNDAEATVAAQEKVNANVPAAGELGTAPSGAGVAENIQQRSEEYAAGTEGAKPAGVEGVEPVATEPVAGEVTEQGALEEQQPAAPAAPAVTTEQIKNSIATATQILRSNNLPYSMDLLSLFIDRNTGLVDKDAVVDYVRQKKAAEAGATEAPDQQVAADRDQVLNELDLLLSTGKPKKADVFRYAQKLGIFSPETLASFADQVKNKFVTSEEFHNSVYKSVNDHFDSLSGGEPSVRRADSVQAAYAKQLAEDKKAVEKTRLYHKLISLLRTDPKKGREKLTEIVNSVVNKWEHAARRGQEYYAKGEIEDTAKYMRDDPGAYIEQLREFSTLEGYVLDEAILDLYYKSRYSTPSQEAVTRAAIEAREAKERLAQTENEIKRQLEISSKLLAEKFEEAINQQVSAKVISKQDAILLLSAANGNTRRVLELISKYQGKDGKVNAIHRLIAKLLLKANVLPEIRFKDITENEDWLGYYSAGSDTVTVDAGEYIQGGDIRPPDITNFIRTFLHETMHAGTVNPLSKTFELLKHFRDGGTEKGLTQEDKDYMRSEEYIAAKNIIEVFDWLVDNHPDKFTNLRKSAEYTYGATNPFELTAEAFLDDELHKILADITLPENLVSKEPMNAWDWFLGALRKLIGLKSVSNNALDQILRSTVKTLRRRKEDASVKHAPLPATREEKEGRIALSEYYKARTNINEPGTATPSLATPATKKRGKAAPKKTAADKIIDRIDKSTLADETVGLIGELARAQSFKEALGILKAGWETLNSKKVQAILPALTTSQIVDWVGDKIPRLKDASRLVERMDTMRMKMLSGMSDVVTPWFDYNKKSPARGKLLSRTMHYTTLAGVDPTLFPDLASALAGDVELVQLNKDFAAATDVKKKATIKGAITKRTRLIEFAYDKLWDKLDSRGQDIYTKVKDYYKATFDLHRALLDRLVKNSTLRGTEDDASTPKGKLMAAIRKSYADALKSGVYFPLMRYGNYWVSVGTGVNREFYMFESEFQRNEFIAKRVQQLQNAGDKRTAEKMQEDGDLDKGNDLTKLRVKAAESSDMLRGIFEMIDKNTASGTTTADAEALKDAVYQMYLNTLPEKDFRKQWIHRKGTAGFSGDALRNFVRAGFSSAGHLSKLRFGKDITLAVDAARDSLKGNPEKPLLEQFVSAINDRTKLELNPTVEDGLYTKFANGVNQAAFTMYLTSVKSAIANMTAIPIFGLPVLGSRYGMGNAAAKLASYGNIFNHTTVVTTKPNGDLQWPSVSVGMSKHVQGNKVLAAAFADAAERGITEITRTYDLLQMSRMPSDALSNPAVKFKRAAVNMMGALFHASERMNREIMYMASFELAYEKAVKEGKTAGVNGEAYNIAVDEAVKNTYDSMFNYSRFNRPTMFRGPTRQILLQFKMFPQQVSVYLAKNFWGIVSKASTPAERKEAATQLFGTLGMTGLFAGAAGMPLYSVMIGILQGIRSAFRDEEEPFPIEDRDLDLWFRNQFLPQVFGVKGAEALYRGLASELGGDIASSTSLNDMWFREVKDNPSLAAEFRDYFFALLGPGVALGENALKAADDFSKGYISQGMEKLTPAMFRGMITAMRWNEEGIKTKGLQAPIYDEEEVTKTMLAWRALGFTPTELSKIQAGNFKAKALADKAEQTKKDILNRINLDIARGDDKHLEKEFAKFAKFLRDYPTVKFDADTILNSVEKRAELRAMANRGLSIPEELQGEIYPLLGEDR